MMKRIIYTILFLSIIDCAYSQNSDIRDDNVTFKVSNVELAEESLKEFDSKKVIENHVKYSIAGYSKSIDGNYLVPTKMHSFIEALHYSYAEHRPICISPDMIWLLICQAVTQHIELNSDSLKNKIVKFEETKEIHVQANYLIKGDESNSWDKLIPSFSDSIKKYVNKDLLSDYDISFSTTSLVESLSFQIAMLNAVDNYFDFWADTECGIPSIKLLGTTKDWKLIYKNLDNFKSYGLNDWINEIKPIIQQFINASQGIEDKDFWNEIYKLKEDCADIYVTGWIMKFFPYKRNSENQIVSNNNIYEENLHCDIAFDRIPNGISKIDFKWKYNPNKQVEPIIYDMQFCAGFVGINQNKESKMLKPEIVWFVKEQDAKRKIDVLEVFKFENEEDVSLNTGTAIENLRLDRDCFAPSNEMFFIVEEMPLFDPENCSTEEEGQEALKKYIRTETQKLKSEKKISGRIIIQFVVSSSGKVKEISVIRSDIPELNEQAIKIVETMPKWKPGKQRGRPVQVRYTLPINFTE